MKKRAYLIAILLLLILVFSIWFFSTNQIFYRKLNFRLPKTAKILNESYSFYYDCLMLRVSFDKTDYVEISNGINNYVEENKLYLIIEDEWENFTVAAFCPWWDESNESIISAHWSIQQGKWGAKTREQYILLTQGSENQYFLHLYY